MPITNVFSACFPRFNPLSDPSSIRSDPSPPTNQESTESASVLQTYLEKLSTRLPGNMLTAYVRAMLERFGAHGEDVPDEIALAIPQSANSSLPSMESLAYAEAAAKTPVRMSV